MEQSVLLMDEASQASSSDDDPSTTNASGEGSRSDQSNDDIHLAADETRAVILSKRMVYFVILIAAIAVSTAAYFVTARDELETFEVEFQAYAKEVLDLSERNAVGTFNSVQSFAVALTSYTLGTNMTWPYITLPDFDRRGREALRSSSADLIAFAPIVREEDREGWEQYAVKNQGWIQDSLSLRGLDSNQTDDIPSQIYVPPEGDVDTYSKKDIHVPLWQMERAPTETSIVMQDLYSVPWLKLHFDDVFEIDHVLLSGVQDLSLFSGVSDQNSAESKAQSLIIHPVFESFEEPQRIGGFVLDIVDWSKYFTNVLPDGVDGIVVEVTDTCGSVFTYEINGRVAQFFGQGDLHDPNYDHMNLRSEFAEFARYNGSDSNVDAHCSYTLSVHPSDKLRAQYVSRKPIFYAIMVGLVFVFTAAVFLFYDWLVQRRQNLIMRTAKRTTAIVASMFPKGIRERILEDVEKEASKKPAFGRGGKTRIKDFLDEDVDGAAAPTAPIADLFPHATIMFGDIVGFTAWSSMREPVQVFTLLETIYHAFDELAKRRRVFKVETVGDCYVAVAGLPDPRKDHYTVMSRFARDCIYRMNIMVNELEVSLGPDTAELALRIGLHSGPVTAGVLRGERARFQLFGDTMNTCSRIESTGSPNMIHISSDTAELLRQAGKGHWLRRRTDTVVAKGKGELTTYWLELKNDKATSSSGSSMSESGSEEAENAAQLDTQESSTSRRCSQAFAPTQPISDKHQRLVNWNADILVKFLRQIQANRMAKGVVPDSDENIVRLEQTVAQRSGIVLDEAQDIVTLPGFDSRTNNATVKDLSCVLDEKVEEQVREYVQTIAALYRKNPFHNFEHASHVTMSTTKFLSRIIAPNLEFENENEKGKDLHDHTYGITSDPLTLFTLVLSSLIHDVDHTGVPNTQLVKEKVSTAAAYKNKSIAEQNSIDISWNLLMGDSFKDLRRAIYAEASEFKRFRELFVNSVLATDIMDKELNLRRKDRWKKAFSDHMTNEESRRDDVNRKATIVIEHVIQASDVAHTMQHWQVYRKWNGRLFEEMYRAFKDGRAEKDPSEFWYEGELGFFDHYIIPLANKLRSCGVFGVSSDECLNYAIQNRKEWESKGRQVVAEMVQVLNTSSTV